VCTKDSCWSVATIYDPRELPGVSTAGPGIGRGVTDAVRMIKLLNCNKNIVLTLNAEIVVGRIAGIRRIADTRGYVYEYISISMSVYVYKYELSFVSLI
jgi:hypothetical protein